MYINWLQEAKELVEFYTWWKFYLFAYDIQGEIVFQKTAKSLGDKSGNELIHSL